jgi:hypothetical protein
MNKIIFTILLFLVLVSCGTQRQIRRTYINQQEAKLKEDFGTPKSIINYKDDKIYIFEKSEELKSTEINQGKLTLDPIITPQVTKTKRYYFTVRDGIIIETRFEKEYER